MKRPFQFKQFDIYHDECAMKVGTDGVLLGAWANVSRANTVLDIGAGTGLIGIMAAQRNENAQITCIDIDESAYRQALKNIHHCPWEDRIEIHHISIQDFINTENKGQFKAIISNPPYFNAGSKAPNAQRHIARHSALLSQIELITAASHLLADSGRFSVILPYSEGILFIKTASQFGLNLSRKCEVRSKANKPIERLLLEFQKKKVEQFAENLVIQYEGRNHWTADYIELTKAFYLKM